MSFPSGQIEIVKKAVEKDLLSEEDNLVIFQDFDVLDKQLIELTNAFPANAQHAVAIKSNPLVKVLAHINEQGFSAEAASIQEVKVALEAGMKASQIVFDSPVKTRKEIDFIQKNLHNSIVNVDSFDELRRYHPNAELRLGLRITVGLKTASNAALDVSGRLGKFGIWFELQTEILQAVKNYHQIEFLHIHQGSQFEALDTQVDGIRKVVDLALFINKSLGAQQIKGINIGGGFPVNYTNNPFPIATYAEKLKEKCPEFWDGTFSMITEFGRSTHAHSGFLVSNIEYVKQVEKSQVIVTHSGADILLRECYQENAWPHKLAVLNPVFQERVENKISTQVAGPLCFGGDFPFRNQLLASANEADKLLIADTGANSFALWSKHCSRPFPKVIGVKKGVPFILKEKESDDRVVQFWS